MPCRASAQAALCIHQAGISLSAWSCIPGAGSKTGPNTSDVYSQIRPRYVFLKHCSSKHKTDGVFVHPIWTINYDYKNGGPVITVWENCLWERICMHCKGCMPGLFSWLICSRPSLAFPCCESFLRDEKESMILGLKVSSQMEQPRWAATIFK